MSDAQLYYAGEMCEKSTCSRPPACKLVGHGKNGYIKVCGKHLHWGVQYLAGGKDQTVTVTAIPLVPKQYHDL